MGVPKLESLKHEAPADGAEMAGSRQVQQQVSTHLAALKGARHLHHSPERRETEPLYSSIPRIGNTLVPFRIHEPEAHAQHLAQLCYERYKKNEAAEEAGLLDVQKLRARRRAKGARRPADAFMMLPSAWRPTWEDVQAEAAASGSPFALSAASLVAGRGLAAALQPRSVWPEECELQKLCEALESGPLLDLKAWVRLANTSTTGRGKGKELSELPNMLAMPEKVLAVISLLHDVRAIRQIDLSGMGLDRAPACLRAFTGVRGLDLSLNRNLVCVKELARCRGLRGLRLSGCQRLWDLRPLASLLELSHLELAGCEALQDLGLLLSGGYEAPKDGLRELIRPRTAPAGRGREREEVKVEAEEVKEDELLQSRKREVLGEQNLWPPLVRPLGHPSLSWLCCSGCVKLRAGLDHLPRCPKLSYVDLYGCLEADGFSCFVAAEAPQVEHLVWPGLVQLLSFAQRAALPQERTLELLEAAVSAVEEKKRLLEEGDGLLPAMAKLVRNAAREAVAQASKEIGLKEHVKVKVTKSIYPEVVPDTEDEAQGSESEEEIEEKRDDVDRCIQPMAFVRKLKAENFRPGAALQGTRLFRVLDQDRDGLVSRKDFSILELDYTGPEEVNKAFGLLLRRHKMVHDVVARDLAGNRKKLDKKRLVECMVIAGAEEDMAGHAARLLIYSARARLRCVLGQPEAYKVALQHALGANVVVYTLQLLQDLRRFLEEKYKGLKKAYRELDVTGRGRVTLEDFASGLEDWDTVSQEVLFRCLDRDGSGAIMEKDFAAFQDYDQEKTLEALVRVGRSLVKFPKERPERLVKLKLDLNGLEDHEGLGRSSFVHAWKDLGSRTEEADGKIVFGVLDFDGEDRIYLERLLVVCDALPKRSEYFGLAKLKQHLLKTHGSLAAAFGVLSGHVEGHATPQGKAAPRRISF